MAIKLEHSWWVRHRLLIAAVLVLLSMGAVWRVSGRARDGAQGNSDHDQRCETRNGGVAGGTSEPGEGIRGFAVGSYARGGTTAAGLCSLSHRAGKAGC